MELASQQLQEYLPHRPPMLLLSRMLLVTDNEASAEVDINNDASFFVAGKGVPAWIGLEYMGQCAALIGGNQTQPNAGKLMGFLLGTRRYTSKRQWFSPGKCLQIRCKQVAMVGDSLANFDCDISDANEVIANAKLSVVRKPMQVES